MSKFIKLLNNPIINHINPTLEQIELINQSKMNKLIKLNLRKYKKEKKIFSLFYFDKFNQLYLKD